MVAVVDMVVVEEEELGMEVEVTMVLGMAVAVEMVVVGGMVQEERMVEVKEVGLGNMA